MTPMPKPRSPLLDAYDQSGVVTPSLQRALDLARQKMFQGGVSAPLTDQPGAGPSPGLTMPPANTPSLTQPQQKPVGGGLVPQPKPTSPIVAAHEQELSRLTTGDTAKTGIEKIKSPWLRTPLQVLDAIGSTFAPALTASLPGTQYHHQGLVQRARGNVESDVDTRLRIAQAENAEAQPELNAAKTEAVNARTAATTAQHEADNTARTARDTAAADVKRAATGASLHQHGFKEDENGNIVPLGYDEMSQEQQSVHDLRASQKELAEAGAALKKAQAENQPVAAQMAQQRLTTAQQNARTAAGRLGLSEKQYEAQYHGTENGEPIVGAPADEAGNPIGFRSPAGAKPSGQVASRAAQGTAIKEAGNKLIQEIEAKKGKIGNLESYWSAATNQSPISDPDVSGLMASLSSFAALQPSLHGFRSHEALKEFEKIIGGIPKNPEALKAAIRSIQGTADIIEKGGQARTVKPKGAPNAPPAGKVRKFNPATGKLDQ